MRYRLPPQSATHVMGRLGGDLAAIAAAGHTVVSLPPPSPSVIEQAAKSGLRFMLEVGHAVSDGLEAASRRERRRLVRDLATRVRRDVRAWKGCDALNGVVFSGSALVGGPRAGADIARHAADELAIAVHGEDAGLLAAWRSAWLPEGQCPAEVDFLIVDLELADQGELAQALMACHRQVGDRPLVLGGVSLARTKAGPEPDSGWLVDTALWCGVGGTLTHTWASGEAIPEPVAANHRTVGDLDVAWPDISVVVTAYNAQDTLEECLHHCERLEYPKLELIVVDDGSTDGTQAIAAAHPRTQLLSIPHSGLAAARNAGLEAGRGELIAYLDADAYPSPEWPWFLAIAALGDGVGGAGGPNVPPADDSVSARVVARSPGGPVPELLGPQRAAHVPGCNMAFWRRVLERLHGFDPVFDAAADDIELQWRLLESGHELGYHPAALVWHHRRPGLLRYLRQQRHYGRSQAILERRCPGRFPTGWRVRNAARRLCADRSPTASVALYDTRYLSLPRRDGALVELAHQWGMPVATVLALTGPLALLRRVLGVPALAALAYVAMLFGIDFRIAGLDRRRSDRTLGIRTRIATFRIVRPLAFRWGHLSGWWELRHGVLDWPPSPTEASAVADSTPPARS